MKVTVHTGSRTTLINRGFRAVLDACKRVKLNRPQAGTTPTPVDDCFRLTEAGDFRITEAGDFRIMEECSSSPPVDLGFGFDTGFDFPFG